MYYTLWDGMHLECQQKMLLEDNKLDPKDWTNSNIQTMKNQLRVLDCLLTGMGYQLVMSYYKHQQTFLELLEKV